MPKFEDLLAEAREAYDANATPRNAAIVETLEHVCEGGPAPELDGCGIDTEER